VLLLESKTAMDIEIKEPELMEGKELQNKQQGKF